MNDLDSAEEAIFNTAQQLQGTEKLGAFLDLMCEDRPGLRTRIERLLAVSTDADEFFARVGVQSADVTASNVPPLTLAMSLTEEPGDRIGRYKLLQVIGEGGMGVVYMAEQEEPVRRRVALKIIKLGMDTRQVVARFEAERQALALMDHPNIARVLDGGSTETGRPYFVMELVQGVPITEFCDRNKLSAPARVMLFIQVCHAIQSAHQKGIIHRDIKPSNVLVTLHHGEPMPKVIDFGVAKATNQKLTEKTLFTQYATMIGTPAYMSPEQAEMSSLDVDTRTDVYALGVLLYELLTGTTPFPERRLRSLGYGEMQRVIMEEEPERPSTRLSTMANEQKTAVAVNRGQNSAGLSKWLQGDLDWIVMKCLEKDRTRRYETANDLAADLKRQLKNEPVTARPPTALYKLHKAWRRNRIVYSAGILIATSMLIGLAISVWQTRRAWRAERDQIRLGEVAVRALDGETKQRTLAESERQRAQDRESEARHRAYASDMNVAKQALDDNNLGHALEKLEQHVPKNPEEMDLRGWEWRYLWGQTRSDASFTLCQLSNEIHSLSVSSNLVAASVDGRGGLSLLTLPDRREVLRLAPAEQNVCVVISPTQPLLACTGLTFDPSGKQRSTLQLWSLATHQSISEHPLDGECAKLAISQDGRTLLTLTVGDRTTYRSEGSMTLWRLPEATVRTNYSSTGFSGLAVTPDLDFAALSGDQTRLIDLRNGRELWRKEIRGRVLAFSPDGRLLAGCSGADLLLWEAATGEEIGRLAGHQSDIKTLLFWPDGSRLASGSADQTIRIWDVSNRSCLDTLRGHRQQVWQLALLPDHQTLVSGCRDGTVCVWDTSRKHPRHPRVEIPESVLAWAFETDSKSVVTLNDKGRVTRWKGPNFEIPEPLLETGPILDTAGFMFCFSKDGRRLALGSSNGLLQVWDIERRVLWRELKNSIGRGRAVMFFADGTRLLTLSVADLLVHDWDLRTGLEIQSWRAPAGIIHFGLSPDERFCVTLGYAGEVELRNLADQSTTKLDVDIRESHDGNYSPDAHLIAIPSSLGFVRVWDTTTWRRTHSLGGFFDEVFGAVFFPDGKRLAAVAGGRQAVRIYDTSTSTWLDTLTLQGDGDMLWPTLISPDGNVIGAPVLGGGKLQLWRAPSWDEINQPHSKLTARFERP